MPYTGRLDDYEQRLQRLSQIGFQVRKVQSIADSVDDIGVRLMASVARTYPFMRPGVVRSLAQAGFGPDHPVTKYASRLDVATQDTSRGIGRRPGSRAIANPYKDSIITPSYRRSSGTVGTVDNPEEARAIQSNRFIGDGDIRAPMDMESFVRDYKFNPPKVLDPKTMETLESFRDFITNVAGKDGEAYFTTPSGQIGGYNASTDSWFVPEPGVKALSVKDLPSEILETTSKPISAADRKVAGVPVLGSFYSRAIKPAARYAGMAASYPVQELNSIIRNIYGVATGEITSTEELYGAGEATDIGIAIEQLLETGQVDTGSGFFLDPDTEVARIRRERELAAGNIGGHAITGGRLLADIFTEPDTKAFNTISGLVDAGITWFGDPTIVATAGAGAASRAAKTFAIVEPSEAKRLGEIVKTGRAASPFFLTKAERDAGLVRGLRNYVQQPVADAWLTSHTNLVRRLRDTKDPYEIAKASGFKIDPQLAATLARSKTDDQVVSAVRGAVNRGKLRYTDELGRPVFKQQAYQLLDTLGVDWSQSRLFNKLPGQFVDTHDKSNAAEQMRRVLVNANVDEDGIRETYNAIARASNPDKVRGAVKRARVHIVKSLKDRGITDDGFLDAITRLDDARHKTMIESLQQQIGSLSPNSDLTIMEEGLLNLSPHFTLSTSSRFIELPDPRRIRRLTSRLRFLTAKDTAQYLGVAGEYMKKLPGVRIGVGPQTGQLRAPFAFMDHAMNEILKPAWLLRLAWPLRVVTEEQIRIANSPMDVAGVFNHPLSWFSVAISKKNLNIDALGNPIDILDTFQRSLVRGVGPWVKDPAASRAVRHLPLMKRDLAARDKFVYSWANHLHEFNQNEITSHLLSTSVDDTVDWLWKGGGKSKRVALSKDYPDLPLSSPDQVRKYVTDLATNINKMTRGDTDLINGIRTGIFNKRPISFENGVVNPEFRKALYDKIDSAPDIIEGVEFSTKYNAERSTALDALFGFFMGAPTNRLSRAPYFKQAYWQHIQELSPAGTRRAQQRILENAEAAGVSKRQLDLMRSNRGRGRLSEAEIHDLAKGYALDDTKNLLYDLTERQQWADILRIVVPFGDAYQEIMSRWGKLAWQQKGRPLYRLKTIMEGARDSGFFHENEFGEEVFTIVPGSVTQWITNNIMQPLGMGEGLPLPLPFTARVEGLNMIGTGLPGLGPALQIPVAWILQRYPEAEEWRDIIAPFGAPGVGETGLLTGVMPAWMRSALTYLSEESEERLGISLPADLTNKRIYANQIKDVAAALMSTGEYGNSRDEQIRLMDDAAEIAKNTTLLLAIGKFALPSSPSVSELLEDSDGKLHSLGVVVRHFWERVDDVGMEEATQEYLEDFGPDGVLAIIPKTVTEYSGGAPRTKEQGQWWYDNPDLANKYPSVFGYFGPQGGEYDHPTYIRSLLEGGREQLSASQWRQLMDDWLGNFYYYNAYDMLGTDSPNEEQRVWLRQVREAIKEDFPYWGKVEGVPESLTPQELTEELIAAVKEPKLRNTRVGEALSYYFDLRDQAMAAVEQYNQATGNTHPDFRNAAAFQPVRAWLREGAANITRDYPEFKAVWTQVLSREMGEDIETRE